MQDFTVAVTNDGYVFRLQSSHHQSVYIRNIRGNFIPLNYTYIISFHTSDIYALMMATFQPKHVAAICNCYSAAVH